MSSVKPKTPKEIVDSWPHYCDQCEAKHPEKSVCDCGACMYKHSKQIPDPMYPIFECKKCGHRHFWD